jgi:hypothetical protein
VEVAVGLVVGERDDDIVASGDDELGDDFVVVVQG